MRGTFFSSDNRKNRNLHLAGLVMAALWLSGCSNFWDQVTSNDFELSYLFTKPNPLVVLRDSSDGDKRAQALRTLHEPNQLGGTKEDQEFVVKTLTAAATTEKQPLCRLAAIESLGRFKDPRAVDALTEAFYNASNFPTEAANRIQCAALASLGSTKNPKAIDLLVKVVKEPQPEGTEQEMQQATDIKISAAHALANFHERKTAEVLVDVMRKEKNVALFDTAYDSLEACTGKNLPPEPKAWEDFLQKTPKDGTMVAEEPGTVQKIKGWFGN